MAITTAAGIANGLIQPIEFLCYNFATQQTDNQNNISLFGPFPEAMPHPSSGIDGGTVSGPVVGTLAYPNPTGSNKTYLTRISASVNNSLASDVQGTLFLVDRLWANSGIANSAAEQAIAGAQIPARDVNGTNNGVGVYAALQTGTSSTGLRTWTLKYTNSVGTTGRTASIIQGQASSFANGEFFRFGLQGSDEGVRSIQSITIGGTYGTLVNASLTLFRPIARLEMKQVGKTFTKDAFNLGMPIIHDSSALHLLYQGNHAVLGSHTVAGQIQLAQG